MCFGLNHGCHLYVMNDRGWGDVMAVVCKVTEVISRMFRVR